MRQYLCIDIGGTKIKSALYNELAIKSGHTKEYDTPKGSEILSLILDIVARYPKVDGVAISSAGVIDPKQGSVVYAGPTIENYIGTNFKDAIETQFNIPTSVENDVNAALLGEYWKGAAKNSHSTFMLTVGTGIGGAFMIGDQLWRGHYLSGGEVGYLNVNHNQFQNVAASSVMVDYVSKELKQEIDGFELFRLVQEGNHIAKDALTSLIHNLCIGISDIMYLLNPETIVLGGGIMAQEEILKPMIHKALDDILIDPRFKSPRIEFAQLENDAGMVGALYHHLAER